MRIALLLELSLHRVYKVHLVGSNGNCNSGTVDDVVVLILQDQFDIDSDLGIVIGNGELEVVHDVLACGNGATATLKEVAANGQLSIEWVVDVESQNSGLDRGPELLKIES